jgi:hypothetical protein
MIRASAISLLAKSDLNLPRVYRHLDVTDPDTRALVGEFGQILEGRLADPSRGVPSACNALGPIARSGSHPFNAVLRQHGLLRGTEEPRRFGLVAARHRDRETACPDPERIRRHRILVPVVDDHLRRIRDGIPAKNNSLFPSTKSTTSGCSARRWRRPARTRCVWSSPARATTPCRGRTSASVRALHAVA